MGEFMEQEFLQLVQIVEGMQKRLYNLEQANQILVRSNKQTIDLLNDTIDELEDYRENACFELCDPRKLQDMPEYPVIQTGETAIEQMIQDGKSMARFGDGEFAAIAGRIRHRFQTEQDSELARRLTEVLHTEDGRLLTGIADNYGSLERYNTQAKREIRRYLKPSVRAEHMRLLNLQKTYYDAYVTRPYIMYADNMTDAPKKRFDNLKRIWNRRKCVFVEGKYTALGVGNDLFDNAAEIARIIAPAENAFRQYDKILEYCLQQEKDSLFLIALGPTATVLAYDLCRYGYQAVDIGHMDLEYEWFLRGEGRRTVVNGKYNNEVRGDDEQLGDIVDEVYLNQIVGRVE